MWGDPLVSIKRLLTNGTVNWAPAGSPTQAQIGRAGILQRLRMLTESSALTITIGSAGSVARDIWGPWNTYTQITVVPNDGAPVRRHSGFGAYLDMIMRSVESENFTPDTVAVSEINAEPIASLYSFPTTAGSGQDFRFMIDLPLTQYIRSLEQEFGFFPTDNPQVQLTLNATVAGNSAASPFTISSGGNTAASATLFPYLTDSGSSATVGSPTIDVRRDVWQTPQNEADDPDYRFVVQTQEDYPQGTNANGATQQTYRFTANSGILLRFAVGVVDGGSSLSESKLANSNSLELLYGVQEAKFQETGKAAHARMQALLGYLPPQGVYIYDLLNGRRLDLADTIDLSYYQEVKFNLNFSSALSGSNSKVIVVHERLVPVLNVPRGR